MNWQETAASNERDRKQLRREAKEWLERPSFPDAPATIRARYAAATTFEDATDMAHDTAVSSMLLSRAVIAMLEFWCHSRTGHVPRGKDLFAHVTSLDRGLGTFARRAFSDAPFAERQAAATEIADRTIGARGFFEWDSGPQRLTDDRAGNTRGLTEG